MEYNFIIFILSIHIKHPMRNIILSVLILLNFSSCITYQYFTIDSSQLQKDDQKVFATENDTLRLTYSFSGGGGPVTIAIFNKTDQPLFINWSKSAFIRSDTSYSLFGSNSVFAGSAVGNRYGITQLTGTVNVQPASEFIPPQTKISRTTINLDRSAALRIAIPDTCKKQLLTTQDGALESYFLATYNEVQSPIRLKSYLTFTIGQGTGTEFI